MSRHALAEYLGVFPFYWDIEGKQHWTTEEVRTALFAALGAPAETDQQANSQLERLHAEAALEFCPSVAVVRVGQTCAFSVNVPESGHDSSWQERRLSYELRFEHGGGIAGSVRLTALSKLSSHEVSGMRIARYQLELPQILSPGYFELTFQLEHESSTHQSLFVVAPRKCYVPPARDTPIARWGVAAQLYGLAKGNRFGMGDFGELRKLCQLTARVGGDAVGLNPLHAISVEGEVEFSPYSPSSRIAFNPLYLDLVAAAQMLRWSDLTVESKSPTNAILPNATGPNATGPNATGPNATGPGTFINYSAVVASKWQFARVLYRHFQTLDRRVDQHAQRFAAFAESSTESTKRFAVFCALHQQFRGEDSSIWGFHQWPPEYRHPESPAVQAFAEAQAEEVEFHLFLQWLCAEQLAELQEYCRAQGMSIGLYLDFALGARAGGADAWMFQELFAPETAMGAPPDELAPQGQNWGLPPMLPEQLRRAKLRPFREALQLAMRYSGAVRIDHVMSLFRLFWVTPQGGAYVRYPLELLSGIVALESVRNRCLVIGEDLGTVPDEVREMMQQSVLHSYKVFIFMKDGSGRFLAPEEYPRDALVVASTHDLPTISGFLTDHDLEVRRRLALHAPEIQARLESNRIHDRRALFALLSERGLWSGDIDPETAIPRSEQLPAITAAIHLCLAETPSRLLMVQLEDCIGQLDQMNLPGTVGEHPNWQRTFPYSVEELPLHLGWQTVIRGVRARRGRTL